MKDLLERLDSPEAGLRRAACDEALVQLKEDPELRDALRCLLREGGPRARFAAAYVLFRAERPTLRLLPALLDSLELDDGDMRWAAAHMLATLGRMQNEVLAVLLHECRQAPSARRRRMTLYALRELAPEHSQTRDVFLAALDDSCPDVRRAALSSLAKLSEPDRSCVDRALRIAEGDPDPRMRTIATVVLPDLVRENPEAHGEVSRVLRELHETDDPHLAHAAKLATGRLGSEKLPT